MDEGTSIAELDFDRLIEREWLTVNGIGGYASSTLPGLNTRKYHGLLVAAMTPPVRRMVILSRVEESVVWEEGHADLACTEYPGAIYPHGHELLRAFGSEPHPRWAYQYSRWTLEKKVRLLHGRNTVLLTYTLVGTDAPVKLDVRPLLALRPIHELVFQSNARFGVRNRGGGLHQVPATPRSPEVFFASRGRFTEAGCWYLNTIYRREQERGYAGLEDVWCPGIFELDLRPGQRVHIACSTDPIDLDAAVEKIQEQTIARTSCHPLRAGVPSNDRGFDTLRRAADAFPVSIVRPDYSLPLAACINGYPWAPPSPRASLIAFSGLYLVTGAYHQAKLLLVKMASLLKDGLLPSQFSESTGRPVYEGADVSLWFINAAYHYFRYTSDEQTLRGPLLEAMLKVIDSYIAGTHLGIKSDVEGLICSGEPGTPTTWMDARLVDRVVTPRAGRPVELNALWYNALMIVIELTERFGLTERADSLRALAHSVYLAFNHRFWNKRTGCCFDVVADTALDPSIRPNQLLAMSLPFPVLKLDQFQSALDVVKRELMTPFGPRTLSPNDPDYVGRYEGHIVNRDRAYHNGSVHPWLLGPFITATLRLAGRGATARADARALLQSNLDYMRDRGLGNLRELFDGDAPHAPGGAIASATSTGELLRCYAEDILECQPPSIPSSESSPLHRASVTDGPTGIENPA